MIETTGVPLTWSDIFLLLSVISVIFRVVVILRTDNNDSEGDLRHRQWNRPLRSPVDQRKELVKMCQNDGCYLGLRGLLLRLGGPFTILSLRLVMC